MEESRIKDGKQVEQKDSILTSELRNNNKNNALGVINLLVKTATTTIVSTIRDDNNEAMATTNDHNEVCIKNKKKKEEEEEEEEEEKASSSRTTGIKSLLSTTMSLKSTTMRWKSVLTVTTLLACLLLMVTCCWLVINHNATTKTTKMPTELQLNNYQDANNGETLTSRLFPATTATLEQTSGTTATLEQTSLEQTDQSPPPVPLPELPDQSPPPVPLPELPDQSPPPAPLPELPDHLLLSAVISSMAEYTRLQSIKNQSRNNPHFRTRRDEEIVCYSELGCFRDEGPFDYLDMLPAPPEEIATKFLLYTRKNQHQPIVFSYFNYTTQASSIGMNLFNSSLSTKIIIHGFGSTCGQLWATEIRIAILAMTDVNIFCVDWESGAMLPNYVRAAVNTRLVGKQVALLIKHLNKHYSTNPTNFHLIGFSLGAHVAGFTGQELKNLSRITGLDPAGPLFESYDPKVRLDSTDALFVDVIHSNGDSLLMGGLGSWEPMGHLDFYPNGGRVQKGCSNLFLGAVRDFLWASSDGQSDGRSLCNHRRAYKFFTESVQPKCVFPAYACDSYERFLTGSCFTWDAERGCGQMGFYADQMWNGQEELRRDNLKSPGHNLNKVGGGFGQSNVIGNGNKILYLLTREDEPFCANQYRVTIESSPSLIPITTYGEIEITLIGQDFINETFMLTQTTKDTLTSNSILQRLLVAHPALQQPTQIQLKYTAYNGWLYSGIQRWSMDSLIITNAFGINWSFCQRLMFLSGIPVLVKLQDGVCIGRGGGPGGGGPTGGNGGGGPTGGNGGGGPTGGNGGGGPGTAGNGAGPGTAGNGGGTGTAGNGGGPGQQQQPTLLPTTISAQSSSAVNGPPTLIPPLHSTITTNTINNHLQYGAVHDNQSAYELLLLMRPPPPPPQIIGPSYNTDKWYPITGNSGHYSNWGTGSNNNPAGHTPFEGPGSTSLYQKNGGSGNREEEQSVKNQSLSAAKENHTDLLETESEPILKICHLNSSNNTAEDGVICTFVDADEIGEGEESTNNSLVGTEEPSQSGITVDYDLDPATTTEPKVLISEIEHVDQQRPAPSQLQEDTMSNNVLGQLQHLFDDQRPSNNNELLIEEQPRQEIEFESKKISTKTEVDLIDSNQQISADKNPSQHEQSADKNPNQQQQIGETPEKIPAHLHYVLQQLEDEGYMTSGTSPSTFGEHGLDNNRIGRQHRMLKSPVTSVHKLIPSSRAIKQRPVLLVTSSNSDSSSSVRNGRVLKYEPAGGPRSIEPAKYEPGQPGQGGPRSIEPTKYEPGQPGQGGPRSIEPTKYEPGQPGQVPTSSNNNNRSGKSLFEPRLNPSSRRNNNGRLLSPSPAMNPPPPPHLHRSNSRNNPALLYRLKSTTQNDHYYPIDYHLFRSTRPKPLQASSGNGNYLRKFRIPLPPSVASASLGASPSIYYQQNHQPINYYYSAPFNVFERDRAINTDNTDAPRNIPGSDTSDPSVPINNAMNRFPKDSSRLTVDQLNNNFNSRLLSIDNTNNQYKVYHFSSHQPTSQLSEVNLNQPTSQLSEVIPNIEQRVVQQYYSKAPAAPPPPPSKTVPTTNSLNMPPPKTVPTTNSLNIPITRRRRRRKQGEDIAIEENSKLALATVKPNNEVNSSDIQDQQEITNKVEDQQEI